MALATVLEIVSASVARTPLRQRQDISGLLLNKFRNLNEVIIRRKTPVYFVPIL